MTRAPARAAATLLVAALGPGVLSALTPPAVPAEADRPAVVEKRVIGESVRGRPIRAWRLGDPSARVTAVAIATLHGDEPAPRQILEQLRDGAPVSGVDLWVVPGANPDGYARGRRKNANGVDLNRNFPRRWAPLDGEVESGPRPASEPETRALMRFLRRVDPAYVVSFHQPLHGVDSYQAKRPRFVRRLSEHLRLPVEEYPCGGGCHGTFTQWLNHNLDGVAVTVEYGEDPSWRRMNVAAPRQLLGLFGGSR
ncbi:MAG TPA: DUF2817 domain-containing protein [Nocardioidaceae bacterium]|nr:DUF2817 domain-containing protein [Nocardioidaceae bacterium]